MSERDEVYFSLNTPRHERSHQSMRQNGDVLGLQGVPHQRGCYCCFCCCCGVVVVLLLWW